MVWEVWCPTEFAGSHSTPLLLLLAPLPMVWEVWWPTGLSVKDIVASVAFDAVRVIVWVRCCRKGKHFYVFVLLRVMMKMKGREKLMGGDFRGVL